MSHELITTAPVDDPHVTIDRDGDELTIHIEGKSKFRLPAAMVTVLIVWGFAAFICPGVLLVTLLLVPIAVIAAVVLHLTRPRLLRRTIETETVLIGPEEILFSRRSLRSYEGDESRDTSLPLRKLDFVEVRDDEGSPPKLLFIDDDGEHHCVGTCLPPRDDETEGEDDPNLRELEWLADAVNDHVESLRDISLDFASMHAGKDDDAESARREDGDDDDKEKSQKRSITS